jgi:type IX secretion system PorP/SprF family membrane protein
MKYLLILLLIFTTSLVKAQDPEFTQFYVNSMYLNPAMVGSNSCPVATSIYRNQWPNLSGQYVTTAVSFEDYIPEISGGLGIMVTSDRAGYTVLSTTGASIAYSNYLNLSKKISIRSALQVSMFQEYLDGSKFRFPDQIDPIGGFILPTQDWTYGGPVTYVSLGAGTVLFSDNFYIGYAVNHINTPNKSLIFGTSQLPMKHTIHLGAVLPIQISQYDIFEWTPSLIYRKQLDFQQVNLGVNINTNPLVAGIWYRGIVFADRYTDAFILSLGIKLSSFNFMYSYDLTLSELTPSTGGAHEVSLVYKLPCKKNRRDKIRSVPCTWYFN